jgi:hypothetical protein
MRKTFVLIGAALLAGCGNSDDFTVDVAMESSKARAELARLDGGTMLRAMSLPAVAVDQSSENELTFTLPGADDGQLRLSFEEAGAAMTRIHVALSLPDKRQVIDGKTMVLDESKAETILQAQLQEWAARAGSGYASLDSLNQLLMGMTVALQDGASIPAAAPQPAFADMGGEAPAWNEDTEAAPSDGEDDFGEPMIDEETDLADAAQPMDDAQGDDPGSDWGSDAY